MASLVSLYLSLFLQFLFLALFHCFCVNTIMIFLVIFYFIFWLFFQSGINNILILHLIHMLLIYTCLYLYRYSLWLQPSSLTPHHLLVIFYVILFSFITVHLYWFTSFFSSCAVSWDFLLPLSLLILFGSYPNLCLFYISLLLYHYSSISECLFLNFILYTFTVLTLSLSILLPLSPYSSIFVSS